MKQVVSKNRKFHRNLKRLRKKQNLSVKELSKETGIPVSRFEMWEHFHVEPGTFYLSKLANYFDVSKEMLQGK